MKHFIYTLYKWHNKEGHLHGKVRLYKVIRNEPKFIGIYDYSFQSDGQAALNCAKFHKVLPRRYFEGPGTWTLFDLKEKGIASFHQL